jgi:hypothetical protein
MPRHLFAAALRQHCIRRGPGARMRRVRIIAADTDRTVNANRWRQTSALSHDQESSFPRCNGQLDAVRSSRRSVHSQSCTLTGMPVLALAILVILVVLLLIPLSIVQRFRVGTRQRHARGWLAMLNLIAVILSAVLFLIGALITSHWIPDALTYTLAGFGAGCLLGVLGVALTRWEYAGGRVQYTPNRWLVLTITILVAARVLYGFWRTWEASRASLANMAWVTAPGVAASMSAGAVALGYYLIFWTGVRQRIRRHERRMNGMSLRSK